MKATCYIVFVIMASFLCGCQESKGPSKDPDENRFYSGYRNIYRSFGQVPLDSTKKQLSTYLDEFPENADAWAFLGSIYFQLEDFEAARRSYLKAVNLNHKKSSYLTSLGVTYNAMNLNDSSEHYLLKALTLQDSTSENYFHLALLYSKEADTAKGLLYADKALQKTNISLTHLSGLSLVYSKAGNQTKSEELFERSKQMGLKDTSGFRQVLNGEMKLETYYRKNHY